MLKCPGIIEIDLFPIFWFLFEQSLSKSDVIPFVSNLGLLSQPVSREICYLVYMISSFYDIFNGL